MQPIQPKEQPITSAIQIKKRPAEADTLANHIK